MLTKSDVFILKCGLFCNLIFRKIGVLPDKWCHADKHLCEEGHFLPDWVTWFLLLPPRIHGHRLKKLDDKVERMSSDTD